MSHDVLHHEALRRLESGDHLRELHSAQRAAREGGRLAILNLRELVVGDQVHRNLVELMPREELLRRLHVRDPVEADGVLLEQRIRALALAGQVAALRIDRGDLARVDAVLDRHQVGGDGEEEDGNGLGSSLVEDLDELLVSASLCLREDPVLDTRDQLLLCLALLLVTLLGSCVLHHLHEEPLGSGIGGHDELAGRVLPVGLDARMPRHDETVLASELLLQEVRRHRRVPQGSDVDNLRLVSVEHLQHSDGSAIVRLKVREDDDGLGGEAVRLGENSGHLFSEVVVVV